MIAAAIRLPFSMMARNASISFSRSMTILPNCGKVYPCLHQLSREPANATSALALREEDVAWTSWTLRTYRRQRAPIFDPQGVARRATFAPRHMYMAVPVDAETPGVALVWSATKRQGDGSFCRPETQNSNQM